MRARVVLAVIAVALGAASAASATELGTLFLTPEERARLDRLRRGEPAEPVAAAAATGDPRTPAVTGYVKRSDGRNTVWLDGTPVTTTKDPRAIDPKALRPQASGKAAGSGPTAGKPPG